MLTPMAGMILGRSFRQVVAPLVHAGVGPRELHEQLDALDDETEVPWARFVSALQRAAASVRRRELVAIGKRIVQASKVEFERWGFDSAEALLTDLDAPFGAKFIDPPETDRLTTAKYEPGYALFRVGVVHPPALVEGYLRGIVETYGGTVNDFACHEVTMEGQRYWLLELRWSTPAKPVRRQRPASGPRLRSVA